MLFVKKSNSFRDSKGVVKNKNQTFNRINLIQRSFSSKRLSRQFPIISSIHNLVDGALVGVILSVALMSSLALHWRHLWIVAFTRLESTRELSHRLVDSTAMLERNLLKSKSFPITMVPTKAEDLIYLDNPFPSNRAKTNDNKIINIFKDFSFYPIHQGY